MLLRCNSYAFAAVGVRGCHPPTYLTYKKKVSMEWTRHSVDTFSRMLLLRLDLLRLRLWHLVHVGRRGVKLLQELHEEVQCLCRGVA